MAHPMSLTSTGLLKFGLIPRTTVSTKKGRTHVSTSSTGVFRIRAVQDNDRPRRLVDIIRLVPEISRNYFRSPSRRALFGGISLLGGFYVAQTISLSFGALGVNDVIAAIVCVLLTEYVTRFYYSRPKEISSDSVIDTHPTYTDLNGTSIEFNFYRNPHIWLHSKNHDFYQKRWDTCFNIVDWGIRIRAVQGNDRPRRLVDIIRLVPEISRNYFRSPSRRVLFGGISLLGGFYVAQTISLSFGALGVNDVIAACILLTEYVTRFYYSRLKVTFLLLF